MSIFPRVDDYYMYCNFIPLTIHFTDIHYLSDMYIPTCLPHNSTFDTVVCLPSIALMPLIGKFLHFLIHTNFCYLNELSSNFDHW